MMPQRGLYADARADFIYHATGVLAASRAPMPRLSGIKGYR